MSFVEKGWHISSYKKILHLKTWRTEFGSQVVQGPKVSWRNDIAVLGAVQSQRIDAKLQENADLG